MTAYGHVLRDLWSLDPDVTYLDHGGFGATPKDVQATANEWRARIERNPTRFLTWTYEGEIRKAAGVLADFIGAQAQDVVFLGNATDGINAALRSLALKPGDEIVIANVAYRAVIKAARYIAARTGAKLVTPEIPVPLPNAEAVVAAFTAALSPHTRLVIVDHIVSATGIVLPVRRVADAAHAAGARVLIDGAHAPGQIALDVPATGADWYVGNCHKWLFAPRACGFMWAAAHAREDLHPLAISHGYEGGFVAEFDWTGTRDPSAFLSVPAAIAFHARLGGPALMARNAALSREAVELVATALQTPRGALPDMSAGMAMVALPERFGATDAEARAMRLRLSEQHKIEIVISALNGRLWLRPAAQAYNEPADYKRLLSVLCGI